MLRFSLFEKDVLLTDEEPSHFFDVDKCNNTKEMRWLL